MLDTWKEMAKTGELSEEQIRELAADPTCEYFVTQYREEVSGIKELSELLKTPKQRRIEQGIDVHLTSQVRGSAEKAAKKRQRCQTRRALRYSMRAVKQDATSKMREEGYSVQQISSKLIQPTIGKGKKT